MGNLIILDACHNKECPFLHIDPETKMRDCPWYDRGFCRHGPSCRHRCVGHGKISLSVLVILNS